MSSSCLEFTARCAFGLFAVSAITVLSSRPAAGADTYFQPILELRGETSSNRDLTPVSNSDLDTYGVIADAAVLIGIATPRGETSIRPRIRFQEYADREDVEPIEGGVALRSLYEGQKSEFELFANYSRRDSFTAELADAEFDDLDPDDPTSPETGNNTVGETRQRLDFRPSVEYRLTERTSVGGELFFQAVNFSGEASAERVDYNYSEASAYMGWAVSPSRSIEVGGYASKYEATDFVDETDAIGATLAFEQDWSESAGMRIEVLYESNDIVSDEEPFEEDVSGFGATLTNYWEGEVSEWRIVTGRSFTPTGRGGKSTSDQLRVQYDRELSDRLRLRTALRYLRDEALSDAGSSGDRDYGRLDFWMERFFAPTWSFRGGYTYTYQDRESDPDSADDHRFYLSFIYRGLGRQRR